MFGSLFADTVVYRNDVLMFKRTKTLSDVSFVDVVPIAGEPNVKILISSNILGEKHTLISCDKILELNDDNGSPIEYDCNELTIQSKSNNRAIIPSQIGGILVAIGGGLLFSTLDKEPPELIGTSSSAIEQWGKDSEEFYDGIKLTHKIGYGCIIVGGILIAAGDSFADTDNLPQGFNAD